MNWNFLSGVNIPISAVMIKCGNEWKTKDVSKKMCTLSGYDKIELLSFSVKTLDTFIAPDDAEVFEANLELAADGGTVDEFLIRMLYKDGDFHWMRVNMSFFCLDSAVPYVIVVFTDAQEQKEMEEQLLVLKEQEKVLQEEARRDPLTKLLDKEETKNMVNRLIKVHPEDNYVLFLIDVDNFKLINDTFGHTYGDTVILDVATKIRKQFRDSDVVGRIGGDEFLVFMNNADLNQATEKAQNLCNIMEKEYTGGDVARKISVSIGLAAYGRDGMDYRSLMEKADHAMYRVKQSGKNSYEIARRSDVGPMRSDTKVVERRGEINRSDSEFLSFAISLMMHARNIDGSLNMLLKHIGDRFKLDLVAIFENSINNQDMVMTNYYSERFSYYDRTTFPLAAELESIGVNEFVLLKDMNAKKTPVLAQVLGGVSTDFSETKCAVAISRFEYVGGRTGEIVFISLNESEDMDDSTRTLLQELTRTIAIFVSLRYRMDENKAEMRNFQRMDQVTGMYTLDAFKSKVKSVMAEPQKDVTYFIEYIDINNFGYVNDNYGYKVGDNALKTFAADTMEQDYFVAGSRLYSDFFVMLLQAENRETLVHKVHTQHQRFANIQNHQYPSSSMSISAGIYEYTNCGLDVDIAIENANMAWKIAKTKRAKEPVFFKSEFRDAKIRDQQIVGEFYEALYRDDFRMYLQPKFVLGQREVYGAEALARWQKPDGKVLPPGVFLEPLEQIGYVMELDFYIFEELLKTMTRWQTQNRRPIVVSTNFSGHHFESGVDNFLKRIQLLLSKYSVSPEWIEIEVTESVMVKNVQNLKYCIERLHEIGFRVAIDDFGTGYSSLAVLMDIPADVIKMDKSFIDNGIEGKHRDLIVEIGELVRIAGKEIIFEGIETEEQEKLLLDCGFKHGQGYLCNKPIIISEFEKLYI